jgi:hypothetical protein
MGPSEKDLLVFGAAKGQNNVYYIWAPADRMLIQPGQGANVGLI